MSITTTFQKGVQCIKCKSLNCIPFPEPDGFTSCVYCGDTQNRTLSPPQPVDYKEKYGHLFDDDYEDTEEWNRSPETLK